MTSVPSVSTKRLLGELTREYEANLPSSPAEKYLDQRGITKEAASYFHLGFVTNPRPEERKFANRLAIPYVVGSSIVGIKYRVLDDREPKYKSSEGFMALRVFNPNILRGLHRKIYVCEGELDCITLHILRVPAIAIPGANSWNPIVARALRNRRVVVLADGDGKPGKGAEAGANLAKKILGSVDDGGSITMEDTDVNQYFIDNGGDKLLEYIGWSNE
jgi:DNA primase